MRFAHLAEQIYHRPWFITAEAHASIRLVFERATASGLPRYAKDEEEDSEGFMGMFPSRRKLAIDSDGIATIHALGPLGRNLSKMEKSCGATGFEDIRADYEKALQKGAKGVLLDIDSPGGTIAGTPELAAYIAKKQLPTVAFTEELMASAAYYIAAGADSIVASPSASVGSIGVYIPWIDRSAQYEEAGMKPDPIVNTGGDLKAIGFGGKLTDAQRSFLQEQVDHDFSNFKAHVRAYRTVPDSAMRGQVLSGQQAVGSGLISSIGERDDAKAVLMRRINQFSTAA
jgi:signal peptide peptidase SppA